MADMLGDTTLVSDIRGAAQGPRVSAVLEDPTGKRRRRLRILARLIALGMSIWLVALLLGAVGITPVGSIPFVRAFKPPAPPPVIHKLPRPRPPTVAELQPALPSASVRLRTAAGQQAVPPRVAKAPTKHTRKLRSPATTTTTPATPTTPATRTTPGRGNGKAKGKPQPATTTPTTTTTTPGQSGTSPGHTRTTPPGKSKQTTGTSTTPTPTG
jgi:hypothetical protein